MVGAGPTIGFDTKMGLGGGFMLTTSASASLLASYFDLSRRDVYFNSSVDTTGTHSVDLTTYGVVPMLDASIDLTRTFGNYYLAVGYTVSAALGGASTILTRRYDDIDGNTSPYGIERNDIINQGIYAKAGVIFGPSP
jgi:hypothetical protein